MMSETQSVMNCDSCGTRCQKFGLHRNGLRRFRCLYCKRTYTEPHKRMLDGYLPDAKVTLALQLLLEGNSIRSTERITSLDRNTIMSLLVRAGERCAALMDAKMRNLPCKRLEMDEIWGFVGKKERNVKEGDGYDVGNVWTFCAIDADTKLVPCFVIGQRDRNTTNAFMQDVASRMANRVQVSTDGFAPYPEAIRRAFGKDVDYYRFIDIYIWHKQLINNGLHGCISEIKRLINKPQLYGCNGSSREPSFGPLTGPGGGPRLRSKRL
jgi:transposase-like protein/IS1 family transposase